MHCHAGLGRTGFVICSYLVHEYRMTAHEAIHYIRAKRPGSVQMTKQIEGKNKKTNKQMKIQLTLFDIQLLSNTNNS